MDIVLTHNNMDFDGLAAAYGVTKLYPSARIVLGNPLTGSVRSFIALYRNSLPIVQLKYADHERIQRLFLVDCQHEDRLDAGARKLLFGDGKEHSLTIFDHHERDDQSLAQRATEESVIEPVGAATTLVVDRLRQSKTALTPFDATLLALGIYEDTGCLTFQGTTERDAQSIAYLLQHGVDLSIVSDYLHPKLNEEQTELLRELVRTSEVNEIHGAKVVIAKSSCAKFIDGLAGLTRKLVEIESAGAAFTVVYMRDRVHVVGRSEAKEVDVRAICRWFGGDGHPGAAAAVARDGDINAIADKIKEMLLVQVPPEKRADEIMVSPVRTVLPSVSMDEALRIMTRYGQDGLVVAESQDILGIVSRRDIDQALHHKLGHAPVSGFMSRPVITIRPETPLSQIQETMVREDIGRLPVTNRDNQLLGLVSRQDVLRTLYGARAGGISETEQPDWVPGERVVSEFKAEMESLEEPTVWLSLALGQVAKEAGMAAYAVGGFVRDLVLHQPNFDLDFVIEGNAIALADAMQKRYPQYLKVVSEHERFQTARLEYTFKGEKRMVDFSTARTEFYERPAALPTVEPSKLEQDLIRRDFTINALAICVNPDCYGQLIDHFAGLADINAKLIRILHPFSFIEDPTRILRAAKYASRLGFTLEEKTREKAKRAIALGIFADLGGVRVRRELRLILESPHRLRGLELLFELGARLCYLDAQLQFGSAIKKNIRRAERLLQRFTVKEPWLVYLGLLLSELVPERVPNVLERLHLTNEQKSIVEAGLAVMRREPAAHNNSGNRKQHLPNSQIYRLLHGLQDESLAIAASSAAPGSSMRRMSRLYLERLKDVKTLLNGQDLLTLGFQPSPRLGEVLSKLLDARLDGDVKTRDEELSLAQRWLEERGGAGGTGTSS